MYLRLFDSQLSRTPRFIARTLATQTPLPTASSSTSTEQAPPSIESVLSSDAEVKAIFEGGDVDVTDNVLKMLESES